MKSFEKLCLRIYPTVKDDLYVSGMRESVSKFIFLAALITIVATVFFTIPILAILYPLGVSVWLFPLVPILLIPALFLIILHVPRFNVATVGQRVNSQIAVMGRRLLIQLESGKSLVNALIDIGMKEQDPTNPFSRIAYQLYMGTPLEEALDEAIHYSSSDALKRLLVQIRNSLRTGTDLKHSLKIALEEITRQKIIEFESFGKNLNSMGMFYMIFGTIMPSIGAVIYVFIIAGLGVQLSLLELSLFLIFIIPIQAFFIILFTKMRPELEI